MSKILVDGQECDYCGKCFISINNITYPCWVKDSNNEYRLEQIYLCICDDCKNRLFNLKYSKDSIPHITFMSEDN